MFKPKFKKGDWVKILRISEYDMINYYSVGHVGIVVNIYIHPKHSIVYQIRVSPNLTTYIKEKDLTSYAAQLTDKHRMAVGPRIKTN